MGTPCPRPRSKPSDASCPLRGSSSDGRRFSDTKSATSYRPRITKRRRDTEARTVIVRRAIPPVSIPPCPSLLRTLTCFSLVTLCRSPHYTHPFLFTPILQYRREHLLTEKLPYCLKSSLVC